MRIRWFAVFDQALRSNDVIAVWRVVEQHLDRSLTRAELTAARRAANRYAVAAKVRIIRVPEPAGSGGIRTIPLLARLDANLDDVERLSAIAAGTIADGVGRRRRTGGDAGERAAALVTAIAAASRRVRRLQVAKLGAAQAGALADELAEALSELHDLEQRLRTASIAK